MVDAIRYPGLHASGELARRAASALRLLESCRVCPHECEVDRTAGELGICGAGLLPSVASFGPHHGEERPLVGAGGSGTVFFTHCTLRCVFCQNFDISQRASGDVLSIHELAEVFGKVQAMGCENINLVSPTHYTPQILSAVDIAAGEGVTLPLVWNTSGYESLETLALLDGVVDIYMPDVKYAEPETADRLSGARDYPARAFAALREMHRQVGELQMDARGVATRGLLVRHLVLPGGLAGTAEVMRFVAREISADTYVNVMAQYRPCFRSGEVPEIDRPITTEEHAAALRLARESGLHRIDDG